ncbi:MAG: hypothetical protein WBB69_05820 [Anaerolineales bacterium]
MKKFMHVEKKIRHIIDMAINNPEAAKFCGKSLLKSEVEKRIRVFASSVIRGSQDQDLTGYLYEVDWLEEKAVKKIPIPIDTKHPFWNARGGNRGGRGLFLKGDKLYIATAMSILVFDKQLNQLAEISHPYLADIHEIFIVEDGIWVTSTVHDMVVKIDFNGALLKEWRGDQSAILQKKFGYHERNLNLSLDFSRNSFEDDFENYKKDEIFHINSVWVEGEDVYILSCWKNAFIRIFPKPEEIITIDNSLHHPHNGILSPAGTIIINDTKHQYLREYDLKSGKRLKTLSTPVFQQNIRGSSQFSRPGWQRGLVHVVDTIYLVGTSPATIFEVDIDRGLIGKILYLENNVSHSIHGLGVYLPNL